MAETTIPWRIRTGRIAIDYRAETLLEILVTTPSNLDGKLTEEVRKRVARDAEEFWIGLLKSRVANSEAVARLLKVQGEYNELRKTESDLRGRLADLQSQRAKAKGKALANIDGEISQTQAELAETPERFRALAGPRSGMFPSAHAELLQSAPGARVEALEKAEARVADVRRMIEERVGDLLTALYESELFKAEMLRLGGSVSVTQVAAVLGPKPETPTAPMAAVTEAGPTFSSMRTVY
jgi:hypothetical protein